MEHNRETKPNTNPREDLEIFIKTLTTKEAQEFLSNNQERYEINSHYTEEELLEGYIDYLEISEDAAYYLDEELILKDLKMDYEEFETLEETLFIRWD